MNECEVHWKDGGIASDALHIRNTLCGAILSSLCRNDITIIMEICNYDLWMTVLNNNMPKEEWSTK